ncbi:MAG: ATP-binding protein [Bdellovibrionales bacterium]
MWIKREISDKIRSNTDSVQILRGPRQCGKSSLILNLDPEFKEVSLDDMALRHLAQNDPEMLLKPYEDQKVFIDEAQYAPLLFPAIKQRVDKLRRAPSFKRHTFFRISGSNQILMDRNVKESLAGRASFFEMNTLSISEILSARDLPIQKLLFLGGWPEIHAHNLKEKEAKKYMDDYISSYVEKDVVLTAGIQKSSEFLKFLRLLAGRVGNILDLAGLAREVGVDSKTIKEWTHALEGMNIIRLVQPYSTNLSKRLVKSPKIYFIDLGLACRLQGWSESEPLLTSPNYGQLFENLVFSEIYKLKLNTDFECKIFYWRSRDGEEIDFLLEFNPQVYLFIEAKASRTGKARDIGKFPEVRKVFKNKIPPFVVCVQEGTQILGNQIPVRLLSEYLKKTWLKV